MKKTCPTCRTEKTEADFAKDRTQKDGLQRSCRQCHKEYNEGRFSPRLKADQELSRIRRQQKSQCLYRLRRSNIQIQKMTMEQFLALKLLRVYKSRDYVLVHQLKVESSKLNPR